MPSPTPEWTPIFGLKACPIHANANLLFTGLSKSIGSNSLGVGFWRFIGPSSAQSRVQLRSIFPLSLHGEADIQAFSSEPNGMFHYSFIVCLGIQPSFSSEEPWSQPQLKSVDIRKNDFVFQTNRLRQVQTPAKAWVPIK